MLFELISARYERRSMLITANQPFGEWGKVFPDPAMTLAAVDRLVHHATIFEMNVESYRRREAIERKRGPDGRPHTPHPPTSLLIDAPRQSNRQNLLRATINAAIITTAATPDSHPDCRAPLIQIVALHSALTRMIAHHCNG